MTTLGIRLAEVVRRLERAAEAADRNPAAVRLVAVGKTFPLEVIMQAFAAGATVFGENRVQEGVAKAAALPEAEWHLIGPLQRNKARSALEAFSVIHTLDRPELADRLQRLMEQHWPGRRQRVLVEVNVGEEPQKAGVAPAEAGMLVEKALSCPALKLEGLMVIPPFSTEAEASRPHYRRLCVLRDDLEQRLGVALPEMSMGMSHDFEVAIAEGATLVRVGTAIFGQRAKKK